MQRRPPVRVATVQKGYLSIKQVANALDIIALRGQMDGMILCRLNRCAEPADPIEKQRDLFMTSVPGHFDEAFEVTAVPFRVCRACVQQDPHSFKMPFSYCKVDRRRVKVFRTAQIAIAVQQASKCDGVAGCGGGDRVPDITPQLGIQFRRFDHAPAHEGFESGPALESVRPGEDQLSIVQGEFLWIGARIPRGSFGYGLWIAGTNCVQQLLRLTFELIEIRVLGEHAGREKFLHNDLLSWLVRMRISRARSEE